MANHEDLRREDDAVQGSDRSFGIVFTVVFALLGLWQLSHGRNSAWWLLAVSLVLLALALLRPGLLAPLNRLWFRFGLLLHRIVSPLVMAVLFFGSILPVAMLMRLCGKRPLQLRFEPKAESYWIRREPPGPVPDSFRNQF